MLHVYAVSDVQAVHVLLLVCGLYHCAILQSSWLSFMLL